MTVTQIVKEFPAFHGTRNFITVLQESATDPYPELDEPSPRIPTLFL
jgi:hypothetical protein